MMKQFNDETIQRWNNPTMKQFNDSSVQRWNNPTMKDTLTDLLETQRNLGDVPPDIDLTQEQHRFQLFAVQSQQLADVGNDFAVVLGHFALLTIDILKPKS